MISGPALETHQDHEPDRINFQYGETANRQDTRLRLACRHAGDGLQADEDGRTEVAHVEGL